MTHGPGTRAVHDGEWRDEGTGALTTPVSHGAAPGILSLARRAPATE